ncbi:MAG: LD-carboxypeptidase [Bacteroidales bacterium]|nr:LD-carboxypeptidase [Bacteroidales bacterium]
MKALQYPPFLKPNDSVIMVSPSSRIDKKLVSKAKERLEAWGLKVSLAKHVVSAYDNYAGTEDDRRVDFQEAMDNKKYKAIFCTRGGYGAVHFIDQLDFTQFKQSPKWLIGYSDITALHLRFNNEGFATLHGPMARHLATAPEGEASLLYLKGLLFGKKPTYFCPSHQLNRKGKATGVLWGGNLSVLGAMQGTPYAVIAKETILFVEDIGEHLHAIERFFYNLKHSGVLDQLSGLIVGQFTDYLENQLLGRRVYRMLSKLLKPYSFPVCYNFPTGHTKMNYPLICGSYVQFNVENEKITLSFIS